MAAKTYSIKGRGKVAWRDKTGFHIVTPDARLTKADLKKIPAVFHGKFDEVDPVQDEEPAPEQPVRSMEMKTDKAIAHIGETDAEKLKGFLSDHEERETVLEAWDKKFQEDAGQNESKTPEPKQKASK